MSYTTLAGLRIHWMEMAGRKSLKLVATSVPLAFWLTPSRCWKASDGAITGKIAADVALVAAA